MDARLDLGRTEHDGIKRGRCRTQAASRMT